MGAPENFAGWLDKHTHHDPKFGFIYKYHSRSDAHSIALCTFILADLLEKCAVLRDQAARNEIAYGINVRHTWPNGKRITVDLAIGVPQTISRKPNIVPGIERAKSFRNVFASCEAKTVMTEHGKSEPRLFDELGSSHEIVHQGSSNAIAAGITVVNISETFVSPLRQTKSGTPYVSKHRQPDAAESWWPAPRKLRRNEVESVA